jgi:dolichol-phosphate mannosyltransferase
VTASFEDTTVIIPTLDEEANIGRLLDALLELYPGIAVTVVDDGSRDRTQQIVRSYSERSPKVKLLDRRGAAIHGLTVSVVEGALAATTRFFVVIDGDLQHPPEKIRELHDRLAGGADVVVGRREKVLVPWPWHRRAISWAGVRLGRLRLRLGGALTSDTMSGFFAARTDLFRAVAAPNAAKFEPTGYKVLFDFLKLVPASTRVEEVPYEFGRRAGGSSKIAMNHLLVYVRSLLRF